MDKTPLEQTAGYSLLYPPPPRVHWAVLLVVFAAAEAGAYMLFPHPYRELVMNLVASVWPIYLCIWIRKIDPRSSSLYWAIASLVTGLVFSWLLWIVVIFEIREELLEHYNRREPIDLRLNLFLTILFSVFYFQFKLNKITREKEQFTAESVPERERSLIA
jgi:hypothetical protein